MSKRKVFAVIVLKKTLAISMEIIRVARISPWHLATHSVCVVPRGKTKTENLWKLMENSTETKPATKSNDVQVSTVNENQSVSINTSQLVSICAVGLIICFFLPWISFFFWGKPSGFDLAKLGAKAEGNAVALVFLWAIPFFSLVTVLAGMVKQSQKNIAQFTGVLPCAALAYALFYHGSDLMKILEFGAYISLFLGLVLFILPRRLK